MTFIYEQISTIVLSPGSGYVWGPTTSKSKDDSFLFSNPWMKS